ncbi:hypothetical protein QAD02_012008 [Eretmocerus hayati]|uniref:Uncharacterized protein n=1 Tax=Eretmocerus hayati TaxID=131215 RepID=A0ACC2NYP6_9HYME|nr:hypothetical protein QAD02_012008 [Eretmocerus hayati]
MAQLLNLSLVDSNKFIIVDESTDAIHARNLIFAWLDGIRKKGIHAPVNILLFSSPCCSLQKSLTSLDISNVHIEDYFSVNNEKKRGNVYKHLTDFVSSNSRSIFVLDCINTLALQIGLAQACRFVEKLIQNHHSNVFCIHRRDFHHNIPRIQTMSNLYVKIDNSVKPPLQSKVHYEVSVVHKKPGGSISRWKELVTQDIVTLTFESKKIVNNPGHNKVNKPIEVSAKPETTFRIEINEEEMKQRESVPLPYILPGNPGAGSRIIYVPDEADDFDEEDPDEDLDF